MVAGPNHTVQHGCWCPNHTVQHGCWCPRIPNHRCHLVNRIRNSWHFPATMDTLSQQQHVDHDIPPPPNMAPVCAWNSGENTLPKYEQDSLYTPSDADLMCSEGPDGLSPPPLPRPIMPSMASLNAPSTSPTLLPPGLPPSMWTGPKIVSKTSRAEQRCFGQSWQIKRAFYLLAFDRPCLCDVSLFPLFINYIDGLDSDGKPTINGFTILEKVCPYIIS